MQEPRCDQCHSKPGFQFGKPPSVERPGEDLDVGFPAILHLEDDAFATLETTRAEHIRPGTRQVLDAYKQVTGTSGDYQVENAKKIATLNIGGSGTTSVCFVVGA